MGRAFVCERVRSQISTQLDGELSQLERAMVDRHLGQCLACAEYRDEVAAVAAALRTAPVERPQHPVAVYRPRRAVGFRLQAVAAAAVAVVSVGVASELATRDGSSRPSFAGAAPALRFPTQRELEREQALLRTARVVFTAPGGTRDTAR